MDFFEVCVCNAHHLDHRITVRISSHAIKLPIECNCHLMRRVTREGRALAVPELVALSQVQNSVIFEFAYNRYHL